MFDRLFDVLSALVGYLQFCCSVDPFEGAVVLTFGKVRERKFWWERWKRRSSTLEPGFHFYWPFGIERVLSMNTAFDSMDLGPQSVTTKDGQSVILRAYVSYIVFDVRRALLEADGAEGVLGDVAPGEIEDRVRLTTWDDIRKQSFRDKVKASIQKQSRKWGIGVRYVKFSDCTRSKSLRLFNDGGE